MVGIIIIVLLVYAFVGVLAFVPYFIGFIPGILTYILDIFSYNIYPVGSFVYWVLYGCLLFLLVKFFISPFLLSRGS